MKALLLGCNGQLGFELQRALAPLAEVVALGHGDCDLTDAKGLRDKIVSVAPALVVNAAAYTAVDKAETEADKAHAINAVALGVIGAAARQVGARVVHYSTDYVFDGTKAGSYCEDDKTNPLGVYGASKRDGEAALLASGAEHFIFRTSWVFGAHGGNFAKTILRLAAEKESLNVVADQIGAPTSATLIADVTAQVLGQIKYRSAADIPSGIYHLAAGGETSWHGFAQAIVRGAARRGVGLRLAVDAIRAIPTSGYPLPARRPANSRLDTSRLCQTFGLTLPDWQNGLDHTLTQILQG